jgi:amino acid adenylation domain-containing protein
MGYLVQSYLDDSARRFPRETSVACEGRSIGYGRLFRRSNRLAHCLQRAGVSRQDRVCILLNRSIAFIEAVMGVLKADAIYVPMDPKSPPERWRRIMADCGPSAVIGGARTLRALTAAVPGIRPAPRWICLDAEEDPEAESGPKGWIGPAAIGAHSGRRPGYRNIDTDLAYILYTSGSTGAPKGVMISHLNIRNYIDWAVDCFGITEADRILGTAPFHFDMSTFDIHCAMKAGAALHIATEARLLFPAKLVQLIEGEGVTLWKGISSLLMYMVRTKSLTPGGMPTLRKVLFGGEPIQTPYLGQWMKTFPEKDFYNVYGPTEATGISTYHHLERPPEDPNEPIPIGRPCANTDVLLLKEDGTEAAAGETGEICIRGSGLSRGYWGDAAKTVAAFVPNPRTNMPGDRMYRTGDLGKRDGDGLLRFAGRLDHQVKYMGYRIDLGEIETAMASTPGVGEAVAILDGIDPGRPEELIGFYDTDSHAETESVFNRLTTCLPPYMIPRRIIPLDRIPRNDRGKIDRGALRRYLTN